MTLIEELGFAGPVGWSVAPSVRISVGVDLADVHRLSRLAEQSVGLAGVLTERELAYCRSRRHTGQHLAARFAAKEAVLKAFGTGLADGIRWTDVEVLKESGGRPVVVLHGAAAERASRLGLRQLEVSLSHTEQLAIAHAVALWAA